MHEPISLYSDASTPRTSQWSALVAAYEELAEENERLEAGVAVAMLRGVAIGVFGSILSSAVLITVGAWVLAR